MVDEMEVGVVGGFVEGELRERRERGIEREMEEEGEERRSVESENSNLYAAVRSKKKAVRRCRKARVRVTRHCYHCQKKPFRAGDITVPRDASQLPH